jgi:flagellar biosynthesis/type III secretory pathway M-ring protein FliF/YscJ
MDTWVWIVIALVAIVVVAGIVWSAVSSRRRSRLQEGFGPEYDRVVDDAPSRREAESELREGRSSTSVRSRPRRATATCGRGRPRRRGSSTTRKGRSARPTASSSR